MALRAKWLALINSLLIDYLLYYCPERRPDFCLLLDAKTGPDCLWSNAHLNSSWVPSATSSAMAARFSLVPGSGAFDTQLVTWIGNRSNIPSP
jgi:hypothetical protein